MGGAEKSCDIRPDFRLGNIIQKYYSLHDATAPLCHNWVNNLGIFAAWNNEKKKKKTGNRLDLIDYKSRSGLIESLWFLLIAPGNGPFNQGGKNDFGSAIISAD